MAVLKDLIVQGTSRFINTAHINDLHANTIAADSGYFNYLKAVDGDITNLTTEELLARNATVVGLLDVKGELHTNSWTNSSIATIDGSFYICPTISGVTQVTITRAVTSSTVTWSMQLNGSLAIENSVYTKASSGTVSFANWTASSKVALTGEVLVNGVWLPLGTLLGTISSSPNTSSMTVSSLHDNGGQFVTLETIGTVTNAQARNIKISLYEFYQSSAYRPIGLYLTSTAGSKSKTFIDIYGGSNTRATSSAYVLATETSVDSYKEYYSKSGSTYTQITDPTGSPAGQGWYVKYDSSGLALPNVRIGNLNGIQPFVVGGVNVEPSGWGIYTDNGYFKGTIVSNAGLIGSYSLTSTYLQSTDGTTGLSVADNSTTASWAFWAGGNTTSTAKFRVDHNGKLYATEADIQGNIISNNGFYVKSSPTGYYIAQMTGSGISLGNAGTDGNTYDGYNILIDPNSSTGGIKLRHNTNVLNKIDTTGMKLFLPGDQINPIAEFRNEYAKIGADTADRIIIDTAGIHGKSSEQVEYFNIDMKSGTVEVPFTIYENTIEGSVDNHVSGTNISVQFSTDQLSNGDKIKVLCQVDFIFRLYDYWFAGEIDDTKCQGLTYPRDWTPQFTFTYGQPQTLTRAMGQDSSGGTGTAVGLHFLTLTANYNGSNTVIINFYINTENRNTFAHGLYSSDWLVRNGYLKKSTGSTIYSDRIYYIQDTSGGRDYAVVSDPVASDISNYYELLIDDFFFVIMFHSSVVKYDSKYGPSFVLGTSIDSTGSRQPFSTIIGQELTAPTSHQVILGKFNRSTSDMLVIGNGESDLKRNNAFRIDNTGDFYLDLGDNLYPRVYCSTASDVKDKVSSTNSTLTNFQLELGCCVLVEFAHAQAESTTNDLTLNIQETGAKPIYNTDHYDGNNWIYDGWPDHAYILFKYDGTRWVRVSPYGTLATGGSATENEQLVARIGHGIYYDDISNIIKTTSEFDFKQFTLKSLKAPHIIDSGNYYTYNNSSNTAATWYYRKYSDGTAECWTAFSKTLSHYMTVSSFYGYYTTVSYPTDLFIDTPILNYNAQVSNAFTMPAAILGNSKTQTNLYCLSSANNSQTVTFHVHAKGLWRRYEL